MPDNLKFFTDGAAYERLMGRWSQLVGAKFIEWLSAPKGLRWLDVGCGNGAFSEALVMLCRPAELHGIDPSEEQLAYARSRDTLKNADFRVGGAQSLPFDNASLDAATMALAIAFIPNPDQAVSEMARVVRPNGWVASYMWNAPEGGLPAQPIIVAARKLGLASQLFTPPGSVYSISETRAVWERAGLAEIETCRVDIATVYVNFEDFWESNTLLGNPVAKLVGGLSPTERERLKTHLHDTLPKDDMGRITYGAFATAVKGRVPS